MNSDLRWSVLPLEALEPLRLPWQALADSALDPNPFYEPNFLMAGRALGETDKLSVLIAQEAGPSGALRALIPLRRPGWRQGWLRSAWMMQENAYTPLTTPLIHRNGASETLSSLLDVAPRLFPASALYMPLLPTARPFWQGLLALIEARGRTHRIVKSFARAAIETGADFETYTGRHGRTLLRRERKLATHGRIQYMVVEGNTSAGRTMLEAFLTLEAKGWKGRRRTALASRSESLAFARQALQGNGPEVLFECLMLNDQPLAINLNLLSCGVLYTVKAAFNEDYRGYSPGNLLDRHTIALATGDRAVIRVDSCAHPEHPLEMHWREREMISAVLVDWTGTCGSKGLETMAFRLMGVEQGLRKISALRTRLRRKISS